MNLNDPVRWAVIDLLKALDRSHGGREHAELLRIAQTLGVEIPPVAPEDEADGEQESEQDRIHEFLGRQPGPVTLARIIAELGVKKWTATNALYRLQRKGRVEHAGHDAWQIRNAG
jgi:hypothetical protein